MAVKRSDLGKHGGSEWVNRRVRQLTKELHELTRKDVYVSGPTEEKGPVFGPIEGGRIGGLEDRIDRLLRLKEVLETVCVSKSTWWSGVKSGRYPAPVRHLGPRITAWRESAIRQLVNGEGTSHE
jgi:predicted DNA-binding transcriptional regulator AlpA